MEVIRRCTACDAELVEESWKETVCARCLIGVAVPRSASTVEERFERLPARLDEYVLMEVLGHGAMGDAYKAQQFGPDRFVAIKILRAGLDSPRIIERARLESETLAAMDHPYVAKVFAASQTPLGRPYLVMEYVAGVPITEYCRDLDLDVTATLRLFQKVCDAVQHAHRRGVIHRDLKPSNVLVTEASGEPNPKVIDFGIARVIAERTGEIRRLTSGEALGTLEYMSPEQLRAAAAPDARTDVYSLGVLLYELLTNTLPIVRKTRGIPSTEDLTEMVETVPEVPSVRVAAGLQECTFMRLDEKTRARRQQALRGELDWIVMRALDKDPDRRYESARDLSVDIERHLTGYPVDARPPGASYVVRKFLRRHRPAAAATLAFLSLLVSASIMLAVQNRRIRTERAVSASVIDLLTGMYEVLDPRMMGPNYRPAIAAALVEDAAARVRKTITANPTYRSMLLAKLGKLAISLSDYKIAEVLLNDALALERAEHRPGSVELAEILVPLANVYNRVERLSEAEQYLREALEIQRLEQPNSSSIAHTLADIGENLWYQGKVDEALPYYEEALSIRRRVLPGDDRATATTLGDLADIKWAQADFTQASSYYRESLDMYERTVGLDNAYVGALRNNRGAMYLELENYSKARTELGAALAIQTKIQGPDHHDLLGALNGLATIDVVEHRLDEAEALLGRAMSIVEKRLNMQHQDAAMTMENLGLLETARSEFDRAQDHFDRAQDIFAARLGPDSPECLAVRLDVANLQSAMGRPETAEEQLRSLLESQETAAEGEDRPSLAKVLDAYGSVLARLGRHDEAESALRRAAGIWRRIRPEE